MGLPLLTITAASNLLLGVKEIVANFSSFAFISISSTKSAKTAWVTERMYFPGATLGNVKEPSSLTRVNAFNTESFGESKATTACFTLASADVSFTEPVIL